MCQALFPGYIAVNKTEMVEKHTAVGKVDQQKMNEWISSLPRVRHATEGRESGAMREVKAGSRNYFRSTR